MKIIVQFMCLFALSIILVSCNKDERQAESSVEGAWGITAITSIYGTFNNNTFISNTQENEIGDLGIFNFSETNVDYNFTRNDTVYTGNTNWNLVTEKVNSGFTRVNQHTLTLIGDFIFDTTFGDDTSNSEKNATEMTLVKAATSDNPVSIIMKLEKQ